MIKLFLKLRLCFVDFEKDSRRNHNVLKLCK